MKLAVLALCLTLCGCSLPAQPSLPISNKPIPWDYEAYTNEEGWNVIGIYGGRLYCSWPGGMGIQEIDTNTGRVAATMSLSTFTNRYRVDWLQSIARGKPKYQNPDFWDLTQHQDGGPDSPEIIKVP